MPRGDGLRPLRVAQSIQQHLAEAFVRELGDPRLSSLVVTRVEVPPDLGLARVWVRLYVGDDDPALRKRALQKLSTVRGRLRRGLAPRLRLKRVPELAFHYDDGHDAVRRVDEILGEIAQDTRED